MGGDPGTRPSYEQVLEPILSKISSNCGLAQCPTLAALCIRCPLYMTQITPLASANIHPHLHPHSEFDCTLLSSSLCTTLLIDCESAAKCSSVGQQWPLLLMTFTCTCYHLTHTRTTWGGRIQLC